MAEINDIDLKLNLIADDQASEAINTVDEYAKELRDTLSAFNDLNPFAEIMDSVMTLSETLSGLNEDANMLRETLSGLTNIDGISTLTNQTRDFVSELNQTRDALAGVRTEVASTIGTSNEDPFVKWRSGLTTVMNDLQTVSTRTTGIDSTGDNSPFLQWLRDVTEIQDRLATVYDMMGGMDLTGTGLPGDPLLNPKNANSASGTGNKTTKSKAPRWATAITESGKLMGELPMQLMYGGMNAMMGYYGIQAVANGTNNFASIQQMMNLNNMSVNGAAQAYAMLGASGLTGSSGVSFLQGMAAQLQKTFTPAVGSGALSQSAILLQSLGITQKDITTSPWELLNTIGSQYRNLIGQGRGSQAAELLNLTGTSQVAPLLQNWGAMQGQMSGINLGMTPKQLADAVQQNITLQGSLQKLSLAFDQLALTLTPLVDKIAKALGDLADAFSSGKGPINDTWSGLKAMVADLGKVPSAILGFMAALKSAEFTMNVLSGAGVIGEVGGGMGFGKLIGKGIGGIGRAFGMGGATAEGTAAAAGGGLLSAAGAVGALIAAAAGLKQVFPAILQAEDTMNKAISSWVSTTGQAIGSWVTTHTQDLTGWAQTTGQQINSWADQSSNAITNWVTQHTSDLIGWTEQTGTSIATWAQTTRGTIDGWTTHLTQWASGLWQSVSGHFTGWTNSLVAWSSRNWTAVSGDFNSWTQSLGAWAKGLWGAVSADFRNWTTSLDNWVKAIWPTVSGDFWNFTASLDTWVQGLWPAVASDFETFTSNIQSWAQNLWQSVKGFFGGLGQDVKNVWNSITGGGGSSNVPSSLGSSQQSFLKTIMPYAQQVAGATGLPLAGIMGQWAYESAWGSSQAAQQNANLAGIIPFGQYGAGKDSAYAGFSNLGQFAQADISVLNQSRYAGARALAQAGGSISSIYSLLSQEGYDTSNPNMYASGVSSLASSIASMIPHLASGGVVDSPTLAVIGEAGPEAVIPLSGARGSRGGSRGGDTYQITISVPGMVGASQIRQLAQQVATEFVNSVKRRGNFDLG